MNFKKIVSCFIFKRSERQQRDNASPSPRRAGGHAESSTAVGGSGSGRSITRRSLSQVRRNPVNPDVDVFTYAEMKRATHNFSKKLIIGGGGFGYVYEGLLDEHVRSGYKKTVVAIKVLDPESVQGDAEWLAEVNVLGQLRHPNLVRLVGYCCQGKHRLLVYEFMAKGSLEKQLFVISVPIPWNNRVKIALDAARGLAFLHGLDAPIIFRDFKASNVLLDEDYKGKLSDFGLATMTGPMGDPTHDPTRILGTFGYAAPEYITTGNLTTKCDVYGFGVVLLEMLIGMRAIDENRPVNMHNLITSCRPMLNDIKKVMKILDPNTQRQCSERSAKKLANLVYNCLSENPAERPDMSRVVEILKPLVALEPIPEEPGEPSSRGAGAAAAAAGITINEGGSQSQSQHEREQRRHGKDPI